MLLLRVAKTGYSMSSVGCGRELRLHYYFKIVIGRDENDSENEIGDCNVKKMCR